MLLICSSLLAILMLMSSDWLDIPRVELMMLYLSEFDIYHGRVVNKLLVDIG